MNACIAQNIESKSKLLIEIKNKLVANLDSIPLQDEYFKLFPSNEKEFKQIFHCKESLLFHKEISYTYLLGSIIKNNPNISGLRIMNIGIDFPDWNKGKYDTGVVREVILTYAYRFTDSFILNFNNLTTKERKRLFTYLADIEAHDSYKAYHMVVNKYKSLNSDIAEYLIKYRNLRIEGRPH